MVGELGEKWATRRQLLVTLDIVTNCKTRIVRVQEMFIDFFDKLDSEEITEEYDRVQMVVDTSLENAVVMERSVVVMLDNFQRKYLKRKFGSKI